MNILPATCKNLGERFDEIGMPDPTLCSPHFSRNFFVEKRCHCFRTGPGWESSSFVEPKQAPVQVPIYDLTEPSELRD